MENAAAAAVETAVSAPLAPPPAVSAPVSPPVAASPTAAPSEQSLLTAALEKLRAAHEPRAALALLDEYRRRFPTGAFAPEAARLRTEALLLVGRKTAALDELEGGASSSTSPDERRVLRGELRAAAGRWQAACADFDDVVRAHAGAIDSRWTDLVERALWGRASCRGHLGDETATKADLREYLHRFPDGRFAKQASRLLGAGE
jgi:TolA-binding protein